jgi:hypothetical protein
VVTGDLGGASEPCTCSGSALSHNPCSLGQPDLGHTGPTAPILTWVETCILDHRRPTNRSKLHAIVHTYDPRTEQRTAPVIPASEAVHAAGGEEGVILISCALPWRRQVASERTFLSICALGEHSSDTPFLHV